MCAGVLVAILKACVAVDDSPRFLEAARDLLEREGIVVVAVATNGATQSGAPRRSDRTSSWSTSTSVGRAASTSYGG